MDETWLRLSHFQREKKGEKNVEDGKCGRRREGGSRNDKKGSWGCETSSCLALLAGVKYAENKKRTLVNRKRNGQEYGWLHSLNMAKLNLLRYLK